MESMNHLCDSSKRLEYFICRYVCFPVYEGSFGILPIALVVYAVKIFFDTVGRNQRRPNSAGRFNLFCLLFRKLVLSSQQGIT